MELDSDSAAARGLHEYVRLVATALGMRGHGWLVQFEPLANVYIALDDRLPAFPTRDVALVWDEEHGWALGVESHSGESLLVLGHLGEDVLPVPERVARAVRRHYAEEPPRIQDPPVFRSAGDDDDLPARLANYAVTPVGLVLRATSPTGHVAEAAGGPPPSR